MFSGPKATKHDCDVSVHKPIPSAMHVECKIVFLKDLIF